MLEKAAKVQARGHRYSPWSSHWKEQFHAPSPEVVDRGQYAIQSKPANEQPPQRVTTNLLFFQSQRVKKVNTTTKASGPRVAGSFLPLPRTVDQTNRESKLEKEWTSLRIQFHPISISKKELSLWRASCMPFHLSDRKLLLLLLSHPVSSQPDSPLLPRIRLPTACWLEGSTIKTLSLYRQQSHFPLRNSILPR